MCVCAEGGGGGVVGLETRRYSINGTFIGIREPVISIRTHPSKTSAGLKKVFTGFVLRCINLKESV